MVLNRRGLCWSVLLLLACAVGAQAASSRTIELRASEVTTRDGGQTIEARGNVRITDGRTVIQAGRAVYVVRERRITLSGGVKITAPDGDLEAAQAVVQIGRGQAIETVDATGNVAVETEGRVLKADRIQYAVSSGALTAAGNVTVFAPPDLIATGKELTAKGRESATLAGRARIQNRDGYIEGDRLEIQERTQTAYLRGNVVGVFQDTRITAEAATLLAKERKAIFHDRVTVTRPGRTMSAERVTLYYQERRLVAEGQTSIRIEEERP